MKQGLLEDAFLQSNRKRAADSKDDLELQKLAGNEELYDTFVKLCSSRSRKERNDSVTLDILKERLKHLKRIYDVNPDINFNVDQHNIQGEVNK